MFWLAGAVEVRRIAAAIVKGVSMRSLARELNMRGSSTVTGNRPWSQGHLRSVMLSPRLAGLRVHGERDNVTGRGSAWGRRHLAWPGTL